MYQIQTNLVAVPQLQVVRTYDPQPTESTYRKVIIDQQAGFSPGKSTTGKFIYLSQYIEKVLSEV